MCGICGIIRFDDKPVSPELIISMKDSMRHRGPDDEGDYYDGRVGLGHLRLSIIDLTDGGHQPMSSDDGRYWLVFNGEIYNYLELRDELKPLGHVFRTDSDSEVLLKSYVEWGDDCLDRFNGMFAFAIYDRLEKSLFCARDRFGIKPLYSLHSDDFFAFASEIPPLLKALPQRPEPDELTIFEYLTFNRTDQTERTFFKSIRKIQHGHIALVKEGKVELKRWYNLQKHVTANNISNSDWRELFESSLRLRLRSDVPVGACLSGGIDSSSIVATLVKVFGLTDLHTFSAVYGRGVEGDESEFIDEMKLLLKEMHLVTPDAATLQGDLERFVCAQGEPTPTVSPYAQFRVMELARADVKVTLDGQGADELLAGYHYFFGFRFRELIRRWNLPRFSLELMTYLVQHRSMLGLRVLFFLFMSPGARLQNRVDQRNYIDRDFVARNRPRSTLAARLYGSRSLKESLLDHFEYKLEHLLRWVDRNSMHHSLEARLPFLDHRLVEATLGLPTMRIMRYGVTKRVLRESMRGRLPERIRLRRDKVGFETPDAEWFRTEPFRRFIVDLLRSESFRSRLIVDPDKCRAQYQAHLNGKIHIGSEIWKWINLELWYRNFIDK